MNSANRLFPPGRLQWLDAARGLALFGMIVTHIFSLSTDDLEPTWAVVFAGRSSALFAVLAGFSLVLASRSRALSTLGKAIAAAVIRGIIIFAIGLVLGTVSTRLAIILTVYGFLFIAASVLLPLRGRTLAALAAVWLVASPLVSHAVRAHWQLEQDFNVPSLDSLYDPAGLLQSVVLTGYYPALQWMSYILVGMALAHVPWSRQTAITASAVGLGTAIMASAISSLLLVSRGWEVLSASAAEEPGLLEQATTYGNWGTVPTDTAWWLAVNGPHTGTPPDLVGTAGVAVAVIGVFCLLFTSFPVLAPRLLLPLTAPGSMALTAYSLHVVLLEMTAGMAPTQEYVTHALVLIGIAMVWKALISRRGPLETAIAAIVRLAARGKRTRRAQVDRVG